MTAKKRLDALERPSCGRDGQLLAHDLKQERAIQIHWWKLRDPGVRIKVRPSVDQTRYHRVRIVKPGPRFL
jgi:hypothetical protein